MVQLGTSNAVEDRAPSHPENIKKIKMSVHRNSCISMRKVARETGISERSVRRIAKNELGIRS